MQTVKISDELNSQCLRLARKSGVTKQVVVERAIEYYIRAGIYTHDTETKMDLFTEMASMKEELVKLRGAFFSYFKVHEAGYSSGTLRLLWLLKSYMELVLNNTYYPISDRVLEEDDLKIFIKKQKDLLAQISREMPPEEFWKVKEQTQGTTK